MKSPGKPLLDFPCSFPLKVMGWNTDDFEARMVAVVLKHVLPEHLETVGRRLSSGGKYLAVTVTFQAQSQAQLDMLYQELHAQPGVVMSL